MGSVRRSLFFSLADSYLGVALQLGSTLVISRLLTPTEVGIFAVAAALAALASTFRDFGVAEYLIQATDLTAEKIQAAFAANLMVSWLMAAVLLASSEAVAAFFRHPGVAAVMQIQAINFLLIPFGAVTIACLRRELNYLPIFIGGALANTTSFLVATVAAYHGFGYMSLAWSSLAGVAVTVAAAMVMRPANQPWMPSLKGFAEVARFGWHATGIYFFAQIGKSAPEAVIGRLLGMASVAFFSRANGLVEIFNRSVFKAVLPICLPYFSQQRREGTDIKHGYLKATVMLTGIGWPFFVMIGMLAFSVVRLLYGPQWVLSVTPAQILCLAAIVEIPYLLSSEAMIAQGRIDRSNRLQLLVQGIRICSLGLIWPFGLHGACWGLVVAGCMSSLISHHFLNQAIRLHASEVALALRQSGWATLLSCTPVALLLWWIPPGESNYLHVLVLAIPLGVAAWLLSLRALSHPLWDEIHSIYRHLRGRRANSGNR